MIWDTGTAISKCIHVSFCGFMSGGWWRFAIRTQRPILNAIQMHCHLQEKLFLSQLLRRTISGGLYKRVPRTWSSSPSKSAGPPVFCVAALSSSGSLLYGKPTERARQRSHFYDDGRIEDGDLGALKLRLSAIQAVSQNHFTTSSQSDWGRPDKEMRDSFSPWLLQLWCPPPPSTQIVHLVALSIQTQLNLVAEHQHRHQL